MYFYKIKSLHQEGVGVILHCFHYGRKKSEVLESLCEKVYYYQRKMNWLGVFSRTPFIVCSRKTRAKSKPLKDDFPIIFEGYIPPNQFLGLIKELLFVHII